MSVDVCERYLERKDVVDPIPPVVVLSSVHMVSLTLHCDHAIRARLHKVVSAAAGCSSALQLTARLLYSSAATRKWPRRLALTKTRPMRYSVA